MWILHGCSKNSRNINIINAARLWYLLLSQLKEKNIWCCVEKSALLVKIERGWSRHEQQGQNTTNIMFGELISQLLIPDPTESRNTLGLGLLASTHVGKLGFQNFASRIFGSFCQEFWLPKNTPSPPLKMKSWPELDTLSFDYPKIPPPPPKIKCCSWGVWRLMAVSPKDTVSFVFGTLFIYLFFLKKNFEFWKRNSLTRSAQLATQCFWQATKHSIENNNNWLKTFCSEKSITVLSVSLCSIKASFSQG